MLKERYFTVNHAMVGQILSDGSRTDLQLDALGSVTGTVDSTGSVQNKYGYSPLGSLQWTSGDYINPDVGWLGTWGYRSTACLYSGYYVRARHYTPISGTWTTVDHFWPKEQSYAYVGNRPTNMTDPSGQLTPCDAAQAASCKPFCAGLVPSEIFTGECAVEHFPDLTVILCGCALPCNPSESVENCLTGAVKQMNQTWGPRCTLIYPGYETPSLQCSDGTHQTMLFRCPNDGFPVKVSLSINCCPCLYSNGNNDVNCTCNSHISD